MLLQGKEKREDSDEGREDEGNNLQSDQEVIFLKLSTAQKDQHFGKEKKDYFIG